MCGRYIRRDDLSAYAELFGFAVDPANVPPPAFNMACTDLADVVRQEADHRTHSRMSWGLVPSWAKDLKTRYINARSETVATSNAFRTSFAKRRCLILGDGVIEWKTVGKQKLPFLFSLKDDGPFAFAGIWTTARIADKPIESCAILTTAPNELFAQVHDRMPVILPRSSVDPWLDSSIEQPESLLELLRPYPSDEMKCVAIHPRVNNARYKAADAIELLAS